MPWFLRVDEEREPRIYSFTFWYRHSGKIPNLVKITGLLDACFHRNGEEELLRGSKASTNAGATAADLAAGRGLLPRCHT